MPLPPEEWLAPPLGATDDTKLAWLRNTFEEGMSYLKNQRAYRSAMKGLDLIADDRSDGGDVALSKNRYNLIKRGIKEIVATISNLRVIPDYQTLGQYKNQEDVLNKRYKLWWYNRHVRGVIKKGLQWAGVCGKGYVYLGYERLFGVSGEADVAAKAKGPFSVIPWQMGEEHDLQKAYSVDICHEVPYFQALARFPLKSEILQSCAKPSSILRKPSPQKPMLSNVWRMFFGKTKEQEPETFPVCYLRERYILDTSMNNTGQVVHMGDPGTSWEYYVYPRGGQMPSGVFQNGTELTRPVRDEDAMLYPARRCIWWTEHGVLEDGPSHYTHGYVPVVPFQFDDWMSEFLGYPLSHDTLPLQRSVRDGLRVVDDSMNAKTRPTVGYAADKVSRNFMKSWDPRKPLQAIGFRGMALGDMKQLISPVLPAAYYDIPPFIMEYIRENSDRIERIMGVMNVTALAKARQAPSGDTLEKMSELMGPIVNEYSHNIESSIMLLGIMIKYLFMQFDSIPIREQVLGNDGWTKEDFDYDPATIVPLEAVNTSRLTTLFDRVREHASRFTYFIKPGSLLELTSLTRKLVLFQLFKEGLVDPWTLYDACDLNGGPPPKGCDNIMERVWEYLRLKAKAEKAIMEEVGIPPQGQLGPHGGHKGTGGRAPSGNAPPALKTRPNGSSTVQESR